jgi:hypothetical protein
MGWLSNIIGSGIKAAKNIGGQVLTNVGTNVANTLVNQGTNAATNVLTGNTGSTGSTGTGNTGTAATGNTGAGFDWRQIIAGALPVISSLQQNDLPYQKELEGIGYNALDTAKMMTPVAMANMQGIIGGPAMGAIDTNLQRQNAQIRTTYNQMGMSGSTAEAQDLARAGQDATSQQYELGRQMASTGYQGIANQMGIADTTFSNLMTMQMQNDRELQDALEAYAAMFAGGGAPGATGTVTPIPDVTVTTPTVGGPYVPVGTVNTGPLTLPPAGTVYPGVGVVNTGPLTLPAAGTPYTGVGSVNLPGVYAGPSVTTGADVNNSTNNASLQDILAALGLAG